MGLGMLGALGGLGEAGVQIGNQMMQGAIRSDLMKEQQDYLRQERERVETVQERKRAEIGKIISGATSGKVDAEGPPTEDGQMPQRQMNEREKMLSSADALGKAGYLDEAVKYQTLAQKNDQFEATNDLKKTVQEQNLLMRQAIEARKERQGDARIGIAQARLDGRGGAGGSGGGRNDDEKTENNLISTHDKWLSANYKVNNPDSGKSEPDINTIEKLQVIRDKFKTDIGARNAISLTREFSAKVGRDVIAKADMQTLERLADSFVASAMRGEKPAVAEKKDAAPAAEEKKPSGGGMLSLPSIGSKAEKTDGPNYDDYIKFKSELDTVKKNASKMSPDAAEQYLATRLPELEKMVKFHSQYRTY